MQRNKSYSVVIFVIINFISVKMLFAEVLDIPGYTYQGSIQTTGTIESSTTVMSPNGDFYCVFAIDGQLTAYSKSILIDDFSSYIISFASESPSGVRSVQAFNRFENEWMVFYIAKDSHGGEGLYSLSFDTETGALKADDVRYDLDSGDVSRITRYEIVRSVLQEYYVFCVKPDYVSWAFISGYDGKDITSLQSIANKTNADISIEKTADDSFTIMSVAAVNDEESVLTVTILPTTRVVTSTTFSLPVVSSFRHIDKIWDYEGNSAFACFLSNATVLVGRFGSVWSSLYIPIPAFAVVPNGYPLRSFAMITEDGTLVEIPSSLGSYHASIQFRVDSSDSLFTEYEYTEAEVRSNIHGFSFDPSANKLLEALLNYDQTNAVWEIIHVDADYSSYVSVRVFHDNEGFFLLLARADGSLYYRQYFDSIITSTTLNVSDCGSKDGFVFIHSGKIKFTWNERSAQKDWMVFVTPVVDCIYVVQAIEDLTSKIVFFNLGLVNADSKLSIYKNTR